MTGDGGLIALTLDECDLLMEWARTSEIWDNGPWGAPDDALFARLREWRARHTSEATP